VVGFGVDARVQNRGCAGGDSECRGESPSPRVREAWVVLIEKQKEMHATEEIVSGGERSSGVCWLQGDGPFLRRTGVRALEGPLRLGCNVHK
jgi:hypothetical protein